MLIIFIFSILSFLLGIILSFTTYTFKVKQDPIIETINELLPQSQCGQCGYPGCYPYANAIIKNAEDINKCIPGGYDLMLQIAELLNIEISKKNLIVTNEIKNYSTVWIDEKNCVGCAKCVLFCPVDAIVGAPNFIHTVLQNFCTGCNICLSHCPTDCIKIRYL